MPVFIHIGLPKTATTFLQRKYFNLLHERKLIVYNPPEVISNIALLLEHHNKNTLDPYLSDLGSRMIDSLAPYKEQKVLISNESLTSQDYFFSYKRNLAFLSKYIEHAKIILTLRHPCDWSISLYRQSVHQQHLSLIHISEPTRPY